MREMTTTAAPPGPEARDAVDTIDTASLDATSLTLEELARRLTASRWLVPAAAAAGAIVGALIWLVVPRAGSTNWGTNARKKIAVFGLSAFTTNPWRKTARSGAGASAVG